MINFLFNLLTKIKYIFNDSVFFVFHFSSMDTSLYILTVVGELAPAYVAWIHFLVSSHIKLPTQ